MRILVIPDVHLKPWMFKRADELMKQGIANKVVQLGDLPDDFGKKNNKEAYIETFDEAKRFLEKYPGTLWVIGNHDISYLYNQWQSGMAYRAKNTALECIRDFYRLIPEDHLAFVYRIDNVIFVHGGITDSFAKHNIIDARKSTVDFVLEQINAMHMLDLWQNSSPIWVRPQALYEGCGEMKMFRQNKYMQVVGHTPMKEVILGRNNVLSCDVFSLDRNKKPYGSQKFVVVDTETQKWEEVD